MMRRGFAFSCALLLAAGCADGFDDGAATSNAALPRAERAARRDATPVERAPPATKLRAPRPALEPAPSELAPPAAESSLLSRLPRSTLFALRFPQVELLAEAGRRTALAGLLEGPGLAPARAALEQGLASIAQGLDGEPELAALVGAFARHRGEVVVALVAIDFDAFDGEVLPSALPFTLALLHDAGESADRIDAPLRAAFDALLRKGGAAPLALTGKGARWRGRAHGDGVQFDLARDGSQFVLRAGPAGGGDAAPFPVLHRPDSFAAAEVVRAAPPPGAGSQPVVECMIQLDAAWRAFERFGGNEVARMLAAAGLTSIRGLRASCSLAREGLDEHVLLHAPAGDDLLTRSCTAHQLDAELLRCLPSDASFVSVQGFDVATAFAGVLELLPPPTRAAVEQGLAGFPPGGTVDLRRDVIENLGPTFATASVAPAGAPPLTLDPAAGLAALSDLLIAIEVSDGSRLRRALDELARAGGMARSLRTRAISGQLVTRLDPSAMPLPLAPGGTPLVPQWWIGDHALLFATSDRAMEKAIAAAREPGARGPAALADALEQEREHLFGLSLEVRDGAPLVTRARRTALGLELESRDGGATMTTALAGACFGVLPSIAIPKLLAARDRSNERAAIAALRAIAAAQEEFRRGAWVDSDGDGRGEFATLAELGGVEPPRGGRGAAPRALLAPDLQPDASGTAQRHGYRFRVDLPMARRRGGGAEEAVVGELAELEYVVLAWPAGTSNAGQRALALGPDGRIWCSDNQGDEQGYQGLARVPARGASEERDRADRVAGVTSVRRGRDGGVWLELE